ncbi:hypothetical protein PInf_017838 [Phytophthora infestans]|nr:hypothetical protein PInf_017838 [Phytophthora infestans]
MADEDRRFRRLAVQLGVPRHVLGPVDTAEAFDSLSIGVEAARQQREGVDGDHEVDKEIDIEGPNDEEEEGNVGELSLTLPSDSASEGLSSDLSLPHSFGHYDQLPTGRGISRFDDHLTALSPGQVPSGRTNRLQQSPQRVATMGANSASSEAVMKQFYEIQVENVRTQLTLSVQAQKELEKVLQQERAAWQAKKAEMELKCGEERNGLEKELKQARTDLMAAQTRHRMDKTHIASLERCRQEVETLRKISSTDKAAAAGASDEIARLQRIAEAKERRLQHEFELSEATRLELENQIKALVDQIDGIKEEQRHNEAIYSDRRVLQKESERLKRDLQVLQREHDDLQSSFDEVSASDSGLHQKIALLTADKAFLQDAKTQLEDQVAKLYILQQEMQAKVKSLREKHDGNLSQNVQLQSETRLHFEKKLDDEIAKFMELSRREIERIRNDGQVVYERENRLLKVARDDALKHVDLLQARLDSVQSISQLKSTLEDKARDGRSARLEIEMLARKVEAHKEEFARLETTSTTRITQLEAALEVEHNKLKEYELLEIDLDGAVVQTGEIAAEGEGNHADGGEPSLKLLEAMTTFEAIPTTTKRRFQQSVLLAQKVVKSQREAIALEQKLNEATSDRTRLQREITELKAKLVTFHQPQSYLLDKLTRREQELQSAVRRYKETQSQLQQLRAQFQQSQEANSSLQQQLKHLLSCRRDLSALKTTVQLLRGKIQAHNHQEELRLGDYKLQVAQNHYFTTPSDAVGTVDPTSSLMVSASAKASPPPSIASKMTQPPTPQRQTDELNSVRAASEASGSSSSISSTPRWYTKLRVPAQQQTQQ